MHPQQASRILDFDAEDRTSELDMFEVECDLVKNSESGLIGKHV